jgi:succinate-acetate transporter protein
MFGMIAFLSYGFFWWSFSILLIIPKMGYGAAADPMSLAFYLFIWGVFSLCMFVATFKRLPWALTWIFFTVVILFWLLAAHFWSESPAVLKAAGIEGII